MNSGERMFCGGSEDGSHGPLSGIKVVEFASIGPAPFCGMLLADLGAQIVRIERPGTRHSKYDITGRNRHSLALDLKQPASTELCLQLLEKAQITFEGFRPGVMERLGLGPDVALARNPALVYGRMTGWGQDGPLAHAAGHDINYIALAGALHAIGPSDKPYPPLNLVGDLGGGALYLAFGMLAALLHARTSGVGQVVDCAMADGAASLLASFYALQSQGWWVDSRASNIGDGGAHYYNTYRCADGQWVSIGAIEPQFYAVLIEKIGADVREFDAQNDRSRWPELRERLEVIFASRTREEWCALLEGTDVCFAPVLSLAEAPSHPHFSARRTFLNIDGVVQPAPAPRFSVTPGRMRSAPESDTNAVLKAWGIAKTEAAGG